MTTFQEPPLQSRRAARQSERADAPPGALADPNSVSQPPASSLAPSAPAAPAAPSPEPLNYATTSRPPLPQYDGQNLRPRRTAETPGHADLPPTEALPPQDVPSYRPKDYSPEGRRAVVPNWAPSYDGTVDFQTQNRDQALAAAPASGYAPEAPVAEGEHTMTRRELRALREADGITAVPTDQTPVVAPYPAPTAEAAAVAPAPVAPEFVAPVPIAPVPIPLAPIAWAPEPVAVVAPPPLVAPAPLASTRLDSALAEFDALAAGRAPVIPAPDAPAPAPGRRAAQQPQAPIAQAPESLAPESLAPESLAPESQAAEPPAPVAQPAPEQQDSLSTFEALFAPPASEPETPAPSAAAQLLAPPVVSSAPAPEAIVWAADPLLSAPAPQGAPAQVPPPWSSPAPVGPASGPTSVGHWSTQADIDDAEQVNESTISRSVGVGSGSATSALVLPSVPEHTIGGPMNSNGCLLYTSPSPRD